MLSPDSLKKFLPLGVVLFSCTLAVCSQGQTARKTVTPAQATSTDEEARFFLQQALVQDSCDVPLSLKVQSATAEEVAALVQKKLAAMDKVPTKPLRVEARRVRPVRLSFDAKKSTVGGVLESAAVLSGAKLWVLPHLLLIAPESALTAKELTLAKKQAYLIIPGYHSGKVLTNEAQKAFVAFVKKDVAALPQSPFTASPDEGGQWTTRISFGQLSPESQAMLQAMTPEQNSFFRDVAERLNIPFKPLVLSSETAVGMTSEDGSLRVIIPGLEFDSRVLFVSGIGWDDEGFLDADWDIGESKPKSPQKAKPSPGLPLDPSAGDS